ncbi:MAG: prepilin-type N-terminal cleavage/methylation domain-containing protein [Bacilli bacterium]|nr:prepilin-type N-terminal cleavage/methylation domain-containing protein [bacterium]MDY2696731.1 prepilin-type N-terminal cleavage/methylation domain-containing protein [Bacilli bacterium]
MKLNNKGVTTIEILISFVLLAIIVVSLYGSVESYKNKQNIESNKNQIMTYKNLLTKEIQDDLIMKGLIDVTVKHQPFVAVPITPETYTVDFSFRDGTKSQLIVKRVLANDYGVEGSGDCTSERKDYFSISYGPEDDLTEYELPDLGSGKNNEGCKVLDLRMSDININTDNDILTIDIRFYHPDFSTKYGIDIACPINFFR